MSKILWLTWKDTGHPAAGGAEIVCRELTKRLGDDGHSVTLLTCDYVGAGKIDDQSNTIIRVGRNRYAHSFQALAYYLRHLRGKFDILIEEVNGSAPYFSTWFAGNARKFLFYHQLGRKNWLYETPAPLAQLGYFGLVPLASRLASWSKAPVITVSESTRQALAQHGFQPERTHIISEGIEITPVSGLHELRQIKKYNRPTLLSFGAMRAMKRTLDQITAFELAKQELPNLQLKIAGSSATAYSKKVIAKIKHSLHARDIEYLGRVSDEDKITLMQKCHLVLQTAIEEGWGLTITEAASQGAPAIAYDVAGLRDSIRHLQTGIVTDENPQALSRAIVSILHDPPLYESLRESAWQWSRQITFDQSYKDFKKILELA